jgi:hypothetical protein
VDLAEHGGSLIIANNLTGIVSQVGVVWKARDIQKGAWNMPKMNFTYFEISIRTS